MTLLILTCLAAANPATIQFLDGNAMQVQISELNDDGVVFADADGVEQRFHLEQLLRITVNHSGPSQSDDSDVQVRLVDDSHVRVRDFSDRGGFASFALGFQEIPKLDTKLISWVRFAPANPLLDKKWRDIVGRDDAQTDLVVIRRANNVLDYLEGAILSINSQTVHFDYDGDALEAPRDRLEGVAYARPLAVELSETVCQLGDVNGNDWSVAKLKLANSELSITSVAGITHVLPWDTIVKLDFAKGNLVYLSDLQWTSTRWSPFLALRNGDENMQKLFRPRLDRGFHGPVLRLRFHDEQTRIRQYKKGIAIQSPTEVRYRLPEGYRRFEAWAGIDAESSASGRVRLTIVGDGDVLYENEIDNQKNPVKIDLSVASVRRLKIRVDPGKNSILGDQLNLCNARLTK